MLKVFHLICQLNTEKNCMGGIRGGGGGGRGTDPPPPSGKITSCYTGFLVRTPLEKRLDPFGPIVPVRPSVKYADTLIR